MSKVAISLAEKPILNFLKRSGKANSKDCIALIEVFVEKAMKDRELSEIKQKLQYPDNAYVHI
jgi:hypothetical protein